MNKKINQAHDLGFKKAMADVRVAKDFFSHYLPENIKQKINLNSLQLCPSTFIDPELSALHTDVLYAVDIFESDKDLVPEVSKGFIFLHVEQQKNPDKMMAWRMVRYACRIIEKHIEKTNSTVLPIIFPLVLYNGNKPYPYSTDLFDLFGDHAELARNTMFKSFKLVDLTQIKDEEIKSHTWSGLMEMLFKHVESSNILEKFELLKNDIKMMVQAQADDYLLSMIKYTLEKAEINDRQALFAFLNACLSPALEKETMTIAEQLRQEGIQQGMQQGIRKGRQEGMQQGIQQGREEGRQEGRQEGKQEGNLEGEKFLLKKQLTWKFGELPNQYKEQIENSTSARLELFAKNLLEATSLEDVFNYYH